jgi:hypothetical protein
MNPIVGWALGAIGLAAADCVFDAVQRESLSSQAP